MIEVRPNIKLYNADCMEIMANYPENYFDLAIVDPPYGIGEDGQRNKTGDRPTKRWKNPKSIKYKVFNDSAPPKREYFLELFRISKNQIIWGGNYFTNYLPPSMGWVVWDKKVDPKEHLSMFELAFSSFKKRGLIFRYLYAGFKKQKKEIRIHPTQKPTALYKWLLKNYAKPEFKILDTHLGSGSSAIAAHYFGVSEFVGIELDEEYFDNAVKRIKRETAQLTMF